MEIKKINFEWKKIPGPYNRYGCESLWIGKFRLASYGYESMIRDNATPFHVKPFKLFDGIKKCPEFQTREECKEYIEKFVYTWAAEFFAHCELS